MTFGCVACKVMGPGVSFCFDDLSREFSSIYVTDEDFTDKVGSDVNCRPGIEGPRKDFGNEATHKVFVPEICE
jgi:hypothetical protein